jgi:type I restriction enzyme, S subunit
MSAPGGMTLSDLVGGGLFNDGDWVETKDQDPHGDVRLVQLADIGQGEFRDRSRRFLTKAKAEELHCTFLEPGDVLIARMPEPLGRACIFPGDEKPAVTAVDVCIVRPGPLPSFHPRWLMWMLNSPPLRSRMEALQSGTTRKRISRKNLATVELPVPPIQEQIEFAGVIDRHTSRLDAAVAALKRVRANLKRFRAGVLQGAVNGQLLGYDSAIWPWTTLGEVAAIQGGIQKQPKRAPNSNHFPFLRVANVLRGRLDLSEIHRMELFGNELERLRLRPGDLLIVEGNGSPAEIGRMAIWDGAIRDCVHQNHIIRARLQEEVMPKWVELYWNSPNGSSRVLEVASSTSGLYTLSVSKVSRLPLPLPPVAEQTLLVEEVQRRLSVAEEQEHEVEIAIRRAEALRQTILAGAFSGQLVAADG